MVTIVEGPGTYRRLDHVTIPLPDGTRLAARIWIPDGAEDRPVPAVLEYLPYRKNDMYAVNDQGRFAYLAAHGYAGVRLDIRGSGDSEGVLTDEYALQEQEDALDAIEWIASQPWCSGAIGMIGKSWGGFNGLQVAARRPPALKAVVSIGSTDDRYADDAHYIGGCLFAFEMLGWGTQMHEVATLPPDPTSVGDAWKQMWVERLEAFHPQIATWLGHQRRDSYWKHGSVCEDFSAITCPVYAVAGWNDGYVNSVLRLMEGLPGPKKALIGPWSHQYAMEPFEPGPHIGFLQECIRFFDECLKGEATGIMDEPPVRIWIQEAVRPATHHPTRPGRWVAEPSWPSPNVTTHHRFLNDGTLDEEPAAVGPLAFVGAQVAGQDARAWSSFGGPDTAPDQRAEDGLSLSFTSAPLEDPLEMLGYPTANLELSVDRPKALVVVRLCDIWPDGASSLIARGLLNLTHRNSHEHPEALRPGERFAARVVLGAIGQVVPAGHRLRVSVSPTYFPWAWPSPETVTLTVHTGVSSIEIPVRSASPLDEGLAAFGPPEIAPKLEVEVIERAAGEHTVVKSPLSGRLATVIHNPGTAIYDELGAASRVRLADGLEIAQASGSSYEITEGDPLSARYREERTVGLARGEWETRLTAASELSSDATTFHFSATLLALDGGDCFFDRAWSFEIPRDLV